jgi:aryl-alcohol dehydrogenase-like predicted oxidoreductase
VRYRRFGSTELTVSEIGFGCARLGGIFQGASRADMVRTLHRAFDHGITFFDTADMYCQGESEMLLGEALRGHRDRVVIASKAGYCLPAQRRLIARIKPLLRPVIQRVGLRREHLPSGLRGSLSQDFSARYLQEAVERSLKRLKTDYLDLYQLHSPPASVLEGGEFLAPLEKLQREGKIRYYGVSCETTPDALICLRYAGISSLQVRLSLLDQSALRDVVPAAAAQGVAIVARECFAGGLLGKPIDALEMEAIIPDEAERAAKRHEIMDYHGLAAGYARPLAQLALQFVRGLEGITITLLGMRTAEQLADNMRHLAAAPLSAEELRCVLEKGAAWSSDVVAEWRPDPHFAVVKCGSGGGPQGHRAEHERR